jgi:hypothetical protein
MDGKFQLQNPVLFLKRIRHGDGIMSKTWGKKRDSHGREVKEKVVGRKTMGTVGRGER